MKYRLLKTDIPVYSFLRPGEVVRYLKSEDIDGNLYQELLHDNLGKVMEGKDGKLSFSAKSTPYTYWMIRPGEEYRTGFQGTYTATERDLEMTGKDLELLAVYFAIGLLTERKEDGLYENYFGKAKWKAVSSEEASDRHAVIRTKEGEHTFYFKRLWDIEEKKDVVEIIKSERNGKKRNTSVHF